jgi:hypothetical protein
LANLGLQPTFGGHFTNKLMSIAAPRSTRIPFAIADRVDGSAAL